MRVYNGRFAAMARARRQRGAWGRHNAGRRLLIGGFTFTVGSTLPLVKAMLGWGWLELAEGWRSWFLGGARAKAAIKPMAQPSPAQS